MASHPTVGVEEEFLLVDPDTGEPVARNEAVARHAAAHGVKLQLELTSCQVETTTDVIDSSGELRAELARLRRVAAEAAEAGGARLLAVGLPPTVPHEFPITDTPRYRRIAELSGMIAHEQGICGCHVHVAVPDREAAVRVSNRLRDAGLVLDDGMIYWDVRPSANFPTVEVRVADVPATVAETVVLATLIRATVMTALEAERRGDGMAPLAPHALKAAYWKSARDGLDGHALDLTESHASAPATELLNRLVDHVRPALHALGDHDLVRAELARIARDGNGAMRQRRAWRRRHDVADVLAEAAAATLS